MTTILLTNNAESVELGILAFKMLYTMEDYYGNRNKDQLLDYIREKRLRCEGFTVVWHHTTSVCEDSFTCKCLETTLTD